MDNATLMAERKENLKRLLFKVVTGNPSQLLQINEEYTFIFLDSRVSADGNCSLEI